MDLLVNQRFHSSIRTKLKPSTKCYGRCFPNLAPTLLIVRFLVLRGFCLVATWWTERPPVGSYPQTRRAPEMACSYVKALIENRADVNLNETKLWMDSTRSGRRSPQAASERNASVASSRTNSR